MLNVNAAEATLKARYPEAKIIDGTYQGPGENPAFGTKATIEITCADCGINHRIATSDLFQVKYCKLCAPKHRRKASKTKVLTLDQMATRKQAILAELADLEAKIETELTAAQVIAEQTVEVTA